MRSDMAKKLVERPRYPGRKRKGRARPLEELPLHEPMSMGRGSKGFGENLAPLRRFLERRIGQPWDRVYGEIRTRLSPASAVHMHVLQHLAWEVERHAVIIDGRPHHPPGYGGYRPLYGSKYDCLYVCPHTGKLARYRLPRKKRS
jgi:hypothetical protein